MSLRLITVNVGAPSVDRARRQLEWLAARPEDIFVLTETKPPPAVSCSPRRAPRRTTR